MLSNSKSNVSDPIQQFTQMSFRVFVLIMYIKVKRPQTQTSIYKHNIFTKYGSSEQNGNIIKTIERMKVKVYSTSKHPLPQYATKQSAGLDLRANIDAPITINPRERVLVPTGLHIQLPEGFEARIQPRSGLALKKGITCLNSPGCVDADYRGDVGVILINHGTEPFTVNDGERIAQMIISKYEQAEWEPVSSIEDLEVTERGEQGFGHSGIK